MTTSGDLLRLGIADPSPVAGDWHFWAVCGVVGLVLWLATHLWRRWFGHK